MDGREVPGGDARHRRRSRAGAPAGALVVDVSKGSPARAGGLARPATWSSSVDGRRRRRSVGAQLPPRHPWHRRARPSVGVLRAGKRYVATLDLEAAPETVPRDEIDDRRRLAARRGAGRQPFAGCGRGTCLCRHREGVIIGDVAGGSPPAQPGWRRGDVVRGGQRRRNRHHPDARRGLRDAARTSWVPHRARRARSIQHRFRADRCPRWEAP